MKSLENSPRRQLYSCSLPQCNMISEKKIERTISASIQQRIGPEYAGPLGILQALADGTKLLFKENLIPSRGDTYLFSIGPSIAVISILLSYLVIPFSSHLVLADLSMYLNIRVVSWKLFQTLISEMMFYSPKLWNSCTDYGNDLPRNLLGIYEGVNYDIHMD